MRRPFLPALLLLLAALPASAQQARQQPQRLGNHQSWTAATHQENGQKVCYAFTRATRSDGGPQNRGAVTLTVTHRANGRDQIAVSVGYPYPRQAEVQLAVGSQEFRAYATQQSSAFFQNGAQLIAAFRNGRDAVARSPGPPGRPAVTDTFPLSGFSNAYEAINRECPAPRPGR
ncbi:invasion associated locus B family protein [Falsiroseomonas sp. CW058]|uniref:invasion associated locus B family protein n=1 Tax=Falsiroseomonas sp. CW058 TaxID=3388664 RepID=UPI003D31D318